MRKRTVRPHRIDSEPLNPVADLADSSSFDTIDGATLMAMFEARYKLFLPALVRVAMSQMAADKALQNVEAGLRNIDDEIRPATPENFATIEAAHTQAFRYAMISGALADTVPADQLHDTTLRFMEAQRGPGGDGLSLRKLVDKLKDAMPPAAGVTSDPTTAPAVPGESPFGTLGARPQTQRRTPVRAKQ